MYKTLSKKNSWKLQKFERLVILESYGGCIWENAGFVTSLKFTYLEKLYVYGISFMLPHFSENIEILNILNYT